MWKRNVAFRSTTRNSDRFRIGSVLSASPGAQRKHHSDTTPTTTLLHLRVNDIRNNLQDVSTTLAFMEYLLKLLVLY